MSRALPLVYANAVAAQLGIAPDKELKERVQKAIDRVFEMQDSIRRLRRLGSDRPPTCG